MINIHTDFHEAMRSDKTERASAQVLQDKTAHNVPDDWSEDDGSDDDAIEESKTNKEKNGEIVLGKRNMTRVKGGKTANKKATPVEVKRSISDDIKYRRHVEISLDSSDTRDTTVEVDDESFRSEAILSDSTNFSASSPSARPIRNRRNRRKVVASSGESDSGSEEASGNDESAASNTATAKQEPEIVRGLKGLSIASAPESNLAALLTLCEQDSAHNFDSFVGSYSITAVSDSSAPNKRGKRQVEPSNAFRKIGEASYSEVFGVWSGSSISAEEPPRVVMKVVPLDLLPHGTSSRRSTRPGVETDEDEVCLTRVEDVRKEIEITRLMNDVHEGFVKLYE